MEHKVLLITYYWHPALGPAVQRWSLLVRELQKAGISPIVLTVKDGTYAASNPDYDEGSSDVRVIRTATREPFQIYNWLRGKKKSSAVGMGDVSGNASLLAKAGNFIRANFFIPDARKGWVPFATKAAKRLIAEENISQVITTGPPHSTHLVGMRLKKAFPDIFWLADFRDPWVNIYYNRHLSRWRTAWDKDKRLETSVLQTADLISVISDGMRNEFEERAQEIVTIMNGYDKNDFPDSPQSMKEENFIVRYTGNFTDNQVVGSIWDAFAEVIENHDLGDRIQFRFTGNVSQGIIDIISHYGLSDRVTLENYCPHSEAVQKMIDADLLLLIIPDAPGNELIITAKIFEYLASGTPILGVGPENGNAADVLRQGGRAPMLDYSDQKAMEDVIANELSRWGEAEGERVTYSSDSIIQFSRQEQAKKLISIVQTN